MRLRLFSTLFVLTGLLPAGAAAGRAQTQPSSVLVTMGKGKVALPPNRASLNLAIETRAASAAQASAENAQKQQRVLAALAQLGFAKGQVEPAGFSVSPNYDYQHRQQLIDYQARTDVKIRVDNLERLGPVIDAALGAGGTEVRNITFVADSAEAGRREALAQALERARVDAATLALAAGGKLGRLIEASTIPPSAGGGVMLEAINVTQGYPMIAPDDVTIEVTVYTRWELAH